MQEHDGKTNSAGSSLDASRKRRRLSNEQLVGAERPTATAQKRAKKTRSLLTSANAASAIEAKVAQALDNESDADDEDRSRQGKPLAPLTATMSARGSAALQTVVRTSKKEPKTALERERRKKKPLNRTNATATHAFGVGSGGDHNNSNKLRKTYSGGAHNRDQNRLARQTADAVAPSLRLIDLWSTAGPLRTSQYFWPRCNAEENDQSLVKIDWIIDYLNNMLLITESPTTLARHQLVLDYAREAGQYRREFSSLEQVTSDDPAACNINPSTVPCTDDPYKFNVGKFRAIPQQSTNIREEVKPLLASISSIRAQQMRRNQNSDKKSNRKRGTDVVSCGTMSEEEEDDDDDDDVVDKHDASGANATTQLQQTDAKKATMTVEQLTKALNLQRGQYLRMYMTQYELDHPHNMSPLHQRLFIGQLNGFLLKHTTAQLQEYTIEDVAHKVFSLEKNAVSAWSPEFIIALARQMSAYVLTLIMRIKRKDAELRYVYGESLAARLQTCLYSDRLRKIQWQVQTMMRYLLVKASAFQQGEEPVVPERPTILSVSVLAPALNNTDAYDGMTPFQRTVRRFLEECQTKGYRRRDGCIYKQVFVDGYRTNAFEPYNGEKSEIKDFVWRSPDMNFEMEMWLDQTSSGNLNDQIVKYLSNTNSPEFFPDLQRQQYVWSFKNGIYDGEQDKFWAYESDEINQHTDSPYFRTECSARYIDKEFDVDNLMSAEAYENPRLIKVEAMTRIFDSQDMSEEVRDWAWGFTGRLYFPVRMLDNYQVVFWLRGVAGTGKSTFVHAIEAPYEAGDIGFIANNIEPLFGLEPLVDKFLLVAPEVKANFSLDAAVFQTMASGDETSVARKNQVAKQIGAWRVPQVYVSNVYPRWVDSSGSIQRRVMCLIFDCVVPEAQKDTTLEDSLKAQLDALIVRACRSYRKMREIVGSGDVWHFVPNEFKLARDEVRRQTTGMALFLEEVLVLSNDDADFVDVNDLQRLHQFKYQSDGGEKGSTVFIKRLHQDLPSFHNLKVSKLDEVTRANVIRNCRLHLPKAREILDQLDWLPVLSKYFSVEEILNTSEQQQQQQQQQAALNDNNNNADFVETLQAKPSAAQVVEATTSNDNDSLGLAVAEQNFQQKHLQARKY